MLTIRFARVGKRNDPKYRIVLQEHSVAPTGRHVAVLGSYDPHVKKAVLKVDDIKSWVEKGAQVSDSVYNLLINEKVLEGDKRSIKIKKSKKETEEAGKEGEKSSEQEKKSEEKPIEKKAEEGKKEEKKEESKEEEKKEK